MYRVGPVPLFCTTGGLRGSPDKAPPILEWVVTDLMNPGYGIDCSKLLTGSLAAEEGNGPKGSPSQRAFVYGVRMTSESTET